MRHPAEPDREMSICTTAVYTHPDQLPDDARGLLDHAQRRSIALGVSWYRNLAQTVYPSSTAIHFYVLNRAGQAVAVLPLRAQKAALGWRGSALSNFYTALYEPALSDGLDPKDLQVLLRAVRSDFRSLSSLWFSP